MRQGPHPIGCPCDYCVPARFISPVCLACVMGKPDDKHTCKPGPWIPGPAELDPLVDVDRIKRRVRDSLYWVEQEPGISVEVVIYYRTPVDVSSVTVDFHVADDSTPD